MLYSMFNANLFTLDITFEGIKPAFPLSEYDFQLIIVPMDFVMPSYSYLNVSYLNQEGEKARFEESKTRLAMLLARGALVLGQKQ